MSRQGLVLTAQQIAAHNARIGRTTKFSPDNTVVSAKPPAPSVKKARGTGVKHGADYKGFELTLKALHLGGFVREHAFHPGRRWRFDFAWPQQKLALEVDGGAFSSGRHNRGAQMRLDNEKQRAATLMGWRVLVYFPDELDTIALAEIPIALRQEP